MLDYPGGFTTLTRREGPEGLDVVTTLSNRAERSDQSPTPQGVARVRENITNKRG